MRDSLREVSSRFMFCFSMRAASWCCQGYIKREYIVSYFDVKVIVRHGNVWLSRDISSIVSSNSYFEAKADVQRKVSSTYSTNIFEGNFMQTGLDN